MSNEGISANQDKSMTQLLDAGETEISGFLRAVTQLFVAEKERTAAKSWIDELERMDCPGESSVIDWRKITIAAAARLVGHGKDKVSRKVQREWRNGVAKRRLARGTGRVRQETAGNFVQYTKNTKTGRSHVD